MAVLTAPAVDTRHLAALAAAGCREAFGDLYEATRDQVAGYLAKHVGSRSVAEDLTSATYLRALGGIESWTDTGRDPAAWLLTIARNLMFDRAKSAYVQRSFPASDMALYDAAQWGSDPAEHVLSAELAATVRAAIGELPAEYAKLLTLRFLHGLSTAETAQAMGKGQGATKAMQYRASQALLRQLPDGFTPP